MKFHLKLFSVTAIILSFGFYQAIAPQTNAQVIYKTSAKAPPSGGGTDQSSSESSSSETLYIVAGVALAAVLGYALYKKFRKEEDSDSSSQTSLNRLLYNEKESFSNRIQEYKEKLPVDFFIAIRNQSQTIPDRTYSVGVSFKF
jgi:hypothetical protein